uniref:(northern house mosquito) hypothetical protein n=1 Tax=Culex pipiens TaxID=7175 RepID=A0A8D8KLG9_CULPI
MVGKVDLLRRQNGLLVLGNLRGRLLRCTNDASLLQWRGESVWWRWRRRGLCQFVRLLRDGLPKPTLFHRGTLRNVALRLNVTWLDGSGDDGSGCSHNCTRTTGT